MPAIASPLYPRKKVSLIQGFLLFCFILYFSQGIFFSQGTFFTQVVLLIILIVSIFYFFKCLRFKSTPPFFKAWTALLFLNVLGFFFTGEFLEVTRQIDYLKAILLVLLPFYPFYYFANQGQVKTRQLRFFFIVLLAIAALQFYSAQSEILAEKLSGNTDVVNNRAYFFVKLIPLVFLFRQKRLPALLALGVISYFVIIGAKRGAFLAGMFGVMLYFFYLIRTIPKRNRLKAYLLIFGGLVFIGSFIYNRYTENEFLQTRIEEAKEGNYSHRDIIYSNILSNWANSENYRTLLLGFGFHGSVKVGWTGHVAHNDWLELLSNFGLLGVTVYLYFFYAAYKASRNPLWARDKRLIMFSATSIWFLTTLFSMGYTASTNFVTAILFAFLVGSKDRTLS